MPPSAQSNMLRIFSEGGIPLAEVRAFLDSIEAAYNGLIRFRNLGRELERFGPLWEGPPIWSKRRGFPLPWLDIKESFVSRRERLVLAGVRLESPGFWDFAGIAAVLTVVLAYIQYFDARKDKKRRAQLEEVALGLDIVKRAYETLKEMRLPEGYADYLLDRLVVRPLDSIGRQHDKGLIQGAKLISEDDEDK